MAHSDFSWTKLLSFFGVGILIFLAFVMFSFGGIVLSNGTIFYGIMSLLSGVAHVGFAVILYRNYIKWSNQNKTATYKFTV